MRPGRLASLLSPALVLFAPGAHADIAIATVGPMTGQFAIFGTELKQGAEQAVADINAAGGVNGEKLTLETEDDGCDAKKAVAVANQLAGMKVALVAGHLCSAASIPAAPVYADAGIVAISPGSTDPKLTDERAGPGIFRVAARDDEQGEVAGAFLAQRFADKNIAIVDDKSPYGKALADETRKSLNAAGKKEILDETYDAGERDYGDLVSKLKAANVDVLYVGGYHPEAALLAQEMRDQGMSTTLVSGDALMTEEYWQAAGDAGEGTLLTFPPDPREDPRNAALVKSFRDKGVEPEGFVLYSYAAVQAWAEAANMAKSTEFQKVVAALDGGSFDTALGPIRFDTKGDATLPGFVIYEWHAGNYSYLK